MQDRPEIVAAAAWWANRHRLDPTVIVARIVARLAPVDRLWDDHHPEVGTAQRIIVAQHVHPGSRDRALMWIDPGRVLVLVVGSGYQTVWPEVARDALTPNRPAWRRYRAA